MPQSRSWLRSWLPLAIVQWLWWSELAVTRLATTGSILTAIWGTFSSRLENDVSERRQTPRR